MGSLGKITPYIISAPAVTGCESNSVSGYFSSTANMTTFLAQGISGGGWKILGPNNFIHPAGTNGCPAS
jgi:hypothetical protein